MYESGELGPAVMFQKTQLVEGLVERLTTARVS